jgi:glycogen phosphorylase
METALDRVRTGQTAAELKQAILDNLYYALGRIPEVATTNDWYMALAFTIRDRMMNDWIEAFARERRERLKIVSYLSAEFLIGPQLDNNLLNVHDIRDQVKTALSELGLSLEKLLAHEPEPRHNTLFTLAAVC